MGIARKLPDSDEKRRIGLNTSKNKLDNTAPVNIVLTDGTVTRLDAMQPDFEAKMQLRSNALRAQANSTALKDFAQGESKMFISHFIQAFNNGVDRGVFSAGDRAFYHLDVNSSSVPLLNTEAAVLLWAKNLINGDLARVTAGGAAMSNPTIAEVAAKDTAFKNINTQQSTLKDAYDTAQEVVSDMRVEVDKLILRIWDEVETAYNDETIESKRRKSREWGVIYVSTKKAIISGMVLDVATGTPLQNVNVTLLEIGDTTQTDIDGKYILKTDFTGEGTLEFALERYATQTFEVTLGEGEELTQDAQMSAA